MATTSQNLGLTIPAMGDAANLQPIIDDLGIIDEFAGAVVENSADAYDQGSTYVAGELCIQNNTVYKCKTDIDTPEAWDESHWEATSLGKEINSLNDQIANEVISINAIRSSNIKGFRSSDSVGSTVTFTQNHAKGISFHIYYDGDTVGRDDKVCYRNSADTLRTYVWYYDAPNTTMRRVVLDVTWSTKTIKVIENSIGPNWQVNTYILY